MLVVSGSNDHKILDRIKRMVYIRCMLRTQLYLPEDLRREIDVVARKEKKPAAQVIRELLKTGINARQQESIGHAFARLALVKAKGPKDLSANLDQYLYEQ